MILVLKPLARARTRIAGLVFAALMTLTAAPSVAQEFRGGGALHSFRNCEAQGWSDVNAVRARFIGAADNWQETNSLSLFLDSGGALNFSFADPFAASRPWRRIWGVSMWENVSNMNPRPRLRIEQIQFLPRAASDLASARSIRVRMVIRDFNYMRGCFASVMLQLERE